MPKISFDESKDFRLDRHGVKHYFMRWYLRTGANPDGSAKYTHFKKNTSTDLKTARSIAANKQLEFDRSEGGLPTIKKTTYQAFVDEYLSETKGLKSHSIIIDAINSFNAVTGVVDIREFNKQAATMWRQALVKQGRRPGGINRYLDVINAMGNKLLNDGYMLVNPMRGLKDVPGAHSHKLFYLTREEIAKYYEASWGNYIIYGMLGFNTGGRPSELLTRTMGDIDLEHNVIHFDDKPKYNFTLKNHARRSVSLLPELREFLVTHFKGRKKDELLIKTESGQPYNEKNFRNMMARFIRPKLNMPQLVPYTMRHTYAAHTLFAHRDIKQLSMDLGHESIRITSKWYAHLLTGYREGALVGFRYGIIPNYTQNTKPKK